jgi:alkanesulfonate monooxygenase SsuD/methylene tetrahydromethanopterin reductase-like flavin-dependent oxidoreductase (luciferase family)
MKFITVNLGRASAKLGEALPGPRERLHRLVDEAVFSEQLGIDGHGIGEHHDVDFDASSPAVILTAIAARTSRIRLLSTVTVLSLHDPVRVAEDYATLDNLSDGRLDLVIGKGNTESQQQVFGYSLADQYERQTEKYELLRRLLREEDVHWSGTVRPPLHGYTTQPRPFQQPPRVWHGSAANPETIDRAARFGDPMFSGNIQGDIPHYQRLIGYYRERWAFHGHAPSDAYTGAGAIATHVRPTSQQAVREYRPVYERTLAGIRALAGGREPVFPTLEDALERGPVFVGSPQQVIEKFQRYHDAFGHEFQHLGDTASLPDLIARASLELFAGQVAPALRAAIPSRPWGPVLPVDSVPVDPVQVEPVLPLGVVN